MRVGWFTTVHVKTAHSQELRLLLSNRRTLLEKRVAIDNEIRGTRSRLSASRSAAAASPGSRQE
jgi:transposase